MKVELKNIHKHFGKTYANKGINLTIPSGSIQGILGENGAGKSTLMKILSGFIQADSGGEIVLDGKSVVMQSPADAIRFGVGMLHQDPLDFPPMKLIDNFLLGMSGKLFPNRKEAMQDFNLLAKEYGFKFDPENYVDSLTVGERQQLEIMRLLFLGARVFILDEPTTGISAAQKTKLFDTLRTFPQQAITTIFVSHKLEDVESLCDRVTVLRAGELVGEFTPPYETKKFVSTMFGKEITLGDRQPAKTGDIVLSLKDVSLEDARVRIDDINVDIRAGEVIGLAGLEGSGQGMFIRACAGLVRPVGGNVTLKNKNLTGKPYHTFKREGVNFLPAARLEEGLVPGLSLTDHFVLAEEPKGVFIDKAYGQKLAEDRIKSFNIRGNPTSMIESLSGGNQQRAELALLQTPLSLVLLEHPTRGLDIESVIYIWSKLKDRCKQDGAAIIFISSDLEEVLQYSDRLLVFFSGKVSEPIDAATTSVEQLGQLIGGKGWLKKETSMLKTRAGGVIFQLIAFLLAMGFVSLILLAVGASPMEAYKNMLTGSVGSMRKFAEVLVSFVPLLLVTAGLLITFSAGLWNIGVEGQIVLGAIGSVWVLRQFVDSTISPAIIITLAILGGMVTGALWASLAGALKTFGGVNEIFGGLGLNFVSTALTLYLIFGPWKREGVASMSGTEPFPDAFSLPQIPDLRISPYALVIALVAIVIVYFILQGTYFGLKIKAVGKNIRAAYLLGIPTWQYSLYSFLICGALAGIAGGLQVTAVYHRLIPSISSGYGYLGLMVAMLVNYQAIWALPVALFFAALNIGSIQLPIVMQLDSSLSGVLQGVLVLFVLLTEGVRQKFVKKG